MATEVRHIIAASGGDYTSLQAWLTAQARNLVTADEIAVAECRNFDDTTLATVSQAAWVTDATRHIRIEVPVAYRHTLRPRSASGAGYALRRFSPQKSHVHLVGLEIYSIDAQVPLSIVSPAAFLRIDSCLIHGEATGAAYTISGSPASLTLEMRNTVVYGACRSIDTRTMAAATIDNCVFWRSADQLGVAADTELVCRNTYSGKATGTTEDFFTGGAASTGSNNASSDTSAAVDYTTSLTGVSGSSVFVSVTVGAEDFHLKSGTNALVGAGVNRTVAFTLDADGQTRPASGAWDIGADYRDSADTTAPTLTSQSATGGALVCAASVNTDEAGGTLYTVFTASATAPSAAQVEAGQDHAGGVALRGVSQAVSASGTQSVASGSITAGTRYAHFMHKDAAGNSSIVATSASFVVASSGPTINTQPANQSVTSPATATFSVSATASAGSLTYQWQRQPAAGGGFTNISGAVAASYTTGATTVSGGGASSGDQYRVVVTDSNGSTTSGGASLTVAAAAPGLTSSALKNNTGTVLTGVAFEAFVHDRTTGALVVKKTGLTSDGTGLVTFTDAAVATGASYRVIWRRTDTGAEGIETLTAA